MEVKTNRPPIDVTIGLDDSKLSKVKQIVDPFMLTYGQVDEVMSILHKEMYQGMSKDESIRKMTSLQMENTYVRTLLDGTENGDFLALDLGGTNFRVLLCKMRDGKCESLSRNYNVPTHKLYEPCQAVFDHLAESIYLFLKEENMMDKRLPLGFTFSFPMAQRRLNEGILITWTKSFACPDGVGEDAVRLLQEAIERRGDISVDIVAILNDTTGTLLAGSYLDHECFIGLIMGTGCNAAYVEKVDNMEKWDGPDDHGEVVVDIEWGAYGDNGSLDFTKTEFDPVIDKHSNHIGSFTFEKLFSGHYIGDLIRLAMLKLVTEGLLFNGHGTDVLSKWKVFTTTHLSNISKDTNDDMTNTTNVLEELQLLQYSTDIDKQIVRYLCRALSIRASQFVSAAIATLLRHMKRPRCTVAIDGSLYKYHPHLHQMMTDLTAKLAPDTKSRYILAEDGSGRGAAFVAAVAVCAQQK